MPSRTISRPVAARWTSGLLISLLGGAAACGLAWAGLSVGDVAAVGAAGLDGDGSPLLQRVLLGATLLGAWLAPVLWWQRRRREALERSVAQRVEAGIAAGTAALAEANQRLQAQLREVETREQHTTAILRNAPDAFIALDEHGLIHGWNLQAEQLFGWPREEAVGRSMIELLTPAVDRPAQLSRWAEVKRTTAESPRVNRFEAMVLHRQGHQLPVHVAVAALKTVNGYATYAFVHDISERRRAERLLAESVHRLQLVANNTPVLMLHVDTDLRFTFANDRASQWFPAQDGTLIGKTIPEVMGEDTYRKVMPELVRALAGEPVTFERETTHRDGSRAHHLVHYRPDFDEHGVVQGIYGTAIDISARRQAEVALLASEQRLRDITDNLPAMIAYFDAEQRCQFANAPSVAFSGVQPHQVHGTPLQQVLGARYADYLPHVERALAGERTSFDGHQQVGDTRLDVQTHFVPDKAADGTVAGFYVLAYDQTALKDAERRSAAIAHRLRTITDNLPVLIAYIDRDERYQFCNGTFKTWMGVEPADMIGRPIADTMAPADYAHRKPLLQRALAGERTEFELATTQLGIHRHLQTICVPDVAPDGTVAGLYALVSDVAAMKKAEAQLALMANTDALTGLPNRRSLETRLVDALARARRSGRAMALLYLDVDHFKAINDSMGHAAGDEVLKVFAARLRASVRETDTVARLAGDEFIVVLENLPTADEPQFVSRKIIAAVTRPIELNGAAIGLSTSIGIAYHLGGHAEPPQLLAVADKALYEAKQAGRNTFRWASA